MPIKEWIFNNHTRAIDGTTVPSYKNVEANGGVISMHCHNIDITFMSIEKPEERNNLAGELNFHFCSDILLLMMNKHINLGGDFVNLDCIEIVEIKLI